MENQSTQLHIPKTGDQYTIQCPLTTTIRHGNAVAKWVAHWSSEPVSVEERKTTNGSEGDKYTKSSHISAHMELRDATGEASQKIRKLN